MRRRAFLALLGGAAARPLPALAQTMPVVGYLHTQSSRAVEVATAAFRTGLSEGGFAEGRNVAFDYRFADGQVGNLPALAAELVAAR